MITPEHVMSEVDRVMSAPWKWGSADCCASACDVFLSIHGVDPMAPVRGKYDSAMSAARLVATWGSFLSMGEKLAARAGLVDGRGSAGEIGLSHAETATGIEGRAMLICIEPGIWAGKTVDGFAILASAERAWHVS